MTLSMAKYFGTDGIRGRFGASLICPQFAYRLGCALGNYLTKIRLKKTSAVVIGRDTRASGVALSDALISGLNRHEVYVHDASILPTPAIARAVLDQDADLGIAITASHNPSRDNGIKLFDHSAHKLDEAQEILIESFIDKEPEPSVDFPLANSHPLDASVSYIKYLRSLMDKDSLSDWRIVLDLANGAAVKTTPKVFQYWGAEMLLIGDRPDGLNINNAVGSECPAQLAEAVLKHGAHIGIAHDGDGDRLVVCDEGGIIVDGDIILALLGRYALKTGTLQSRTLVSTIHSNLGLDHAISDAGGQVDRVDVGDRNVANRMRELGSNIGGESSGHIIFSDFATTGDGLLAAVKIIELMRTTGKALSELRKEIMLFPQSTANLRVAEKRPLADLKFFQSVIKATEQDLGDEGRVLVRYSGTESKLRILVEGKDDLQVAKAIKAMEIAAGKDLDVIHS